LFSHFVGLLVTRRPVVRNSNLFFHAISAVEAKDYII
jgi:hypothetical protein